MADIALVFHGLMQHPATSRLRNAITNAANGNLFPPQQADRSCARIYLLLSSQGGNLDDGFGLTIICCAPLSL
jgi:hypothetical protein